MTQIRSVYGTVLVEYSYDAWGNVLLISGMYCDTLGVDNPIRYRGYYYDFETDFYYLQSRYYDPAMGRFINADDTSMIAANADFISFNLYAYCGNNPVYRCDDGGEFWHILAGAIIGGVSSLISSAITGASLSDTLISVAFGATSGALCAAFPGGAAAVIGAGMSAAESVVIDIKNNEDVSTIFVDAVVSAGFGAMGGSGDSFFTNKNTYKEAGNVFKVINNIGHGNHPTLKKAAKKTVKKFFKKAGKAMLSETLETLVTDAAEYGTNKYANLVLGDI